MGARPSSRSPSPPAAPRTPNGRARSTSIFDARAMAGRWWASSDCHDAAAHALLGGPLPNAHGRFTAVIVARGQLHAAVSVERVITDAFKRKRVRAFGGEPRI